MDAQPSLHILIIEDDTGMAEFIRMGLTYDGFQVSVAPDGMSGIQQATAQPPDLIILDWMLPGLDGLEVCRRLRSTHDVPIIMLTARDDVHDRVMGLRAGADDYLAKPFHFEELLARIEAVLRRRQPLLNAEQLQFADLILDLNLREARRGGRVIPLTTTEFNLLELFMRHPRIVLSKEQILQAVWGYDFGGDANIVEVYVRALRRKFGEPGLIHTVRLAGYVLREP
jgi:two-component system, OmpR family, response regulator MprA